jgi:hypothetical protein
VATAVGAWENARMSIELLGFAHQAGVRLAEIGFLLVLFAGVWLTAAQIPRMQSLKWGTFRTIVAGMAFAIGGLLLIIATHWGHFG